MTTQENSAAIQAAHDALTKLATIMSPSDRIYAKILLLQRQAEAELKEVQPC